MFSVPNFLKKNTYYFILNVYRNLKWTSSSKFNEKRNFRKVQALAYNHEGKFNLSANVAKLLCSASIVANTKDDLEKSSDIPRTDIEDNLAHLIILAKLAIEKGEIDRAEGILEMGLQISDENKVYSGVPYLYDLLATIAFADGKIEKAETLLVRAIEKLIQVGLTETDSHILDFKLRLARVYSSYGENEMAELGFKSCLETERNIIEAGDASNKTGMLYVNTLFWYGIHLLRNKRFKESRDLLDSAYEYTSKIKGLSPFQEMVIMVTLSDLNYELGANEKSLKYILNAILLGKGISSSDLPRCYYKLARIYNKVNAIEQAKDAAQEGLRLAKVLDMEETGYDLEALLEEIKRSNKIHS